MKKIILSFISCLLIVGLVTGCGNQNETSVPSVPSIADSEYGKANGEVKELIEKMKQYKQTIIVLDYNNWSADNNMFMLENYYEFDLNNKVGYIHDMKVDASGNKSSVNTEHYIDLENDVDYSRFTGWTNWSKDNYIDSLEHYLKIEYFDDYDYAKKGNVLYGRDEEHGDHFIIEIHLNNNGLVDYYTKSAADEIWKPKEGATPSKTSYSYSNQVISIPEEALNA